MSRERYVLMGLLASSPALAAFTSPLQESGWAGIPSWAWIIAAMILLILLALLIWWLFLRISPEQPAPAARPAAPPPSPQPTPPSEPDDLKVIEGIGPKIASLLANAGITTFAQLAAADVGRLKQILKDAGLERLADPTTWPEQARLARDGDWAALEKLQSELKGGRR